MASIKYGNVGQINGKVGDVVVSSWKGKPYVKSIPGERKTPPTEKELNNRKKWAMAQAWLRPVTTFVRQGFNGYTPTVEGFLAAKSYLLKNAFEGEAPDFVINPALVKVSCGELPIPENIGFSQITAETIQFTWSTDNIAKPNKYDQVMLLAYNVEKQYPSFNITGQFRSTGADTLKLSVGRAPGVYHLYVAFVAADRSSQSDSVYLGTVSV
jgi:hypothetical protein